MPAMMLLSGSAFAIPPFLTVWQGEYPGFGAGNDDCHVCHASTGGGSPWNAYGIELVEIYYALGKSDILDAIRIAGDFDSDGDCSTSIDEIDSGSHPGWRYGDTNRFYNRFEDNGQLVVEVVSTMNDPAAEASSHELELGAECGCYLVRATGRRLLQICL